MPEPTAHPHPEGRTPPPRKSVVRLNAESDPSYRPYCLRCVGLVRMKIVEPLYWRCRCGAEHDERDAPPSQEPREPRMEEMAEAVHRAYLDTCARLGWSVKPENQVPYAELSEASKELDRASVRAVLAFAPPAPAPVSPEGLEARLREMESPPTSDAPGWYTMPEAFAWVTGWDAAIDAAARLLAPEQQG